MMDFELLKIIVTIATGAALIFALLFHFWSLEDSDE